MRYTNILFGVFAAATAVLASPLAPVGPAGGVAGSVVTNKGVTYQMQDMGKEIRAFDGKVDNGRYPRPATFQVNGGYHCIFYT